MVHVKLAACCCRLMVLNNWGFRFVSGNAGIRAPPFVVQPNNAGQTVLPHPPGETYLRARANLTENCLKPRAFKLKVNKDEGDPNFY